MTGRWLALGRAQVIVLVFLALAVAPGCSDTLGGLSDCDELTITFDPPRLTPTTIDDGEPFLTMSVTDEQGDPAEGVFIRWENAGIGLGLTDETTGSDGRLAWNFADFGLDRRRIANVLSTQDVIFVEHRPREDSPYCDGPELRIPVDWPPPDPNDFPPDRVPPPHPIEPRD